MKTAFIKTLLSFVVTILAGVLVARYLNVEARGVYQAIISLATLGVVFVSVGLSLTFVTISDRLGGLPQARIIGLLFLLLYAPLSVVAYFVISYLHSGFGFGGLLLTWLLTCLGFAGEFSRGGGKLTISANIYLVQAIGFLFLVIVLRSFSHTPWLGGVVASYACATAAGLVFFFLEYRKERKIVWQRLVVIREIKDFGLDPLWNGLFKTLSGLALIMEKVWGAAILSPGTYGLLAVCYTIEAAFARCGAFVADAIYARSGFLTPEKQLRAILIATLAVGAIAIGACIFFVLFGHWLIAKVFGTQYSNASNYIAWVLAISSINAIALITVQPMLRFGGTGGLVRRQTTYILMFAVSMLVLPRVIHDLDPVFVLLGSSFVAAISKLPFSYSTLRRLSENQSSR